MIVKSVGTSSTYTNVNERKNIFLDNVYNNNVYNIVLYGNLYVNSYAYFKLIRTGRTTIEVQWRL